MGFTTPLYVPLIKGLDESKDPQLGVQDLSLALNVDYTVEGQVKGRPARATPDLFYLRDPATSVSPGPISQATTYIAGSTFSNTGLTQRGLVRVRDTNGERPALGTNGRLFTLVDDRWTDRGHFSCTKVDRIFNFEHGIQDPADNSRGTMTLDFGRLRTGGSSTPAWGLLDDAGALDRESAGTASSYSRPGNGARCGTTTAVCHRGSNGHLYFTYRTAGATSVTTVDLASDAYAHADIGDAPVLCSSHDATNFWLVYRTTTAGVFKVLNLSITGSITATYTSAAVATLAGIWVDNTPVATNRLMVAFTDTSGITIRTLNATTMADLATDSTYDVSGTGADGSDVVIGCQSATKAWWAYRSEISGDGDIAIGVCTVGSAMSAALVKQLIGGSALKTSHITWAICHQPILVDGRMYITLAASTGGQTTATWISLDLTNTYSTSAGTGPFSNPTLVARGPSQATYPHLQPSAAIVLPDDDGWAFPTCDWSSFQLGTLTDGRLRRAGEGSATLGFSATAGLNRVTFSGPRAASLGHSTVFSGSVPHQIAGGDCYDLGFTFCAGIPGFHAQATNGGSIPDGDYGVQVCWRWTDQMGQVHRSAPSTIETVTILAPNSTIQALVTNPWLSEKAQGIYIEVYVTDVNPTDDAVHFLQSSTICSFSTAWTTVNVTGSPALSVDSETIYTDGSVLGNYPVRADGGVCTMGRRMWMADEHTVYASKYHDPGTGPGFNDEGTHQVDVPASAGRIVSLERIDDKLVVFCERGVYFVSDGGPDRTGAGADFDSPVFLSELSIAGPRSSCGTDQGVLFCTALDATDPAKGGPWLLDRQLTLTERQYLGRAALSSYADDDWVPEVAYLPERQQAYITIPVADSSTATGVVANSVPNVSGETDTFTCAVTAPTTGAAFNGNTFTFINDGGVGVGSFDDGADATYHWGTTTTIEDIIDAVNGISDYWLVFGTGAINANFVKTLHSGTDDVVTDVPGVVMFDMRVGKWAVWAFQGQGTDLRSITTSSGALWALHASPAPYDQTPGTDAADLDGLHDYRMDIRTSHMPSNSTSGLGWGRVRSVRALQGKDSGAHTLTMSATLDGTRTITVPTPFALAAPGTDTTWPTTRQSPEWRLQAQKCATLQVTLSATPATATWSAIQLDVTPIAASTPPKNRS